MTTRTQIGSTDNFGYTNNTDLGTSGSSTWQEMNAADGQIQCWTLGYANKYGGAAWCRYIGTGATGYDSGGGPDQYAQCTLRYVDSSNNTAIGVVVRSSSDTGSGRDCYAFYAKINGGGWTTVLSKFTNGTETVIATGSGVTWANGDTLALEVIGTSLTCYRNGTAIGGAYTTTDSTLSTGRPGVFAAVENVLSTFAGDDWQGGTVVAGSGTVRKLVLQCHPSAASAASVQGAVFSAPTGGNITGTKFGEFTGATFDASLVSGKAQLKVPVANFGGAALATTDTPVAIVRNASFGTHAIPCTVIDE